MGVTKTLVLEQGSYPNFVHGEVTPNLTLRSCQLVLYRLFGSCTELCNVWESFVRLTYILYALKPIVLLQAYKPTCCGLLLPVSDYDLVS